MVAATATNERPDRRLRRGARGRYAPPPQLFPLAAADPISSASGRLRVERDADGAYLVRDRDGRLVARTVDPATLQRLLTTLANDERRMTKDE